MNYPVTNALRRVGKIKAAHGIKGEVYVLIFSKDVSWVGLEINLYLDSGTSVRQYKTTKVKPHKDGFIATLSGVTTRNEAEALSQHTVLVESALFQSKNGDPIYLLEVENFEVRDAAVGPIGTVVAFSSNGAQDLLVVRAVAGTGADHEIPFVADFVERIEYAEKTIFVKLPEGLLEINENKHEKRDDEI